MTPSLRNLISFSSLSKPMSADLAGQIVFGDRLADALRHDQVGGEDALQIRVGGDQVGSDVEAGRCLAVGIFVGDELQARIFRLDLLDEAFAALTPASRRRAVR